MLCLVYQLNLTASLCFVCTCGRELGKKGNLKSFFGYFNNRYNIHRGELRGVRELCKEWGGAKFGQFVVLFSLEKNEHFSEVSSTSVKCTAYAQTL